jgi:type I restriction enzyme S subunit
MADWHQTRLGEISQIYSGFAFRSQDLGEHGIPVVKIGNIQNKRVRPECADHLPEELCVEKMNRYFLQPGDTLIAMTGAGSVGKVGKMPRVDERFLVNQRVAIVRPDDSRCDSAFVYFALAQDFYETKLYGLGLGAGQPNVSAKQIGELEIPFPPLQVQRRIAGILSAYDELMENSHQRIRLLEAMARALYREWFVHFRFPGHEKHPRVASPLGDIPQGWEATTLGAHLAALESGKRPKGGIREEAEGVPSIGAENINGIGRHEFASEKLVPLEFFEQMRKGVVRDRDVAIYKDGAYIGKSSYFRDGFPHSECCVNEHVFLLRATGVRLKQNALYIWLQEPDTVQTIRSKNANAAQPGINQQTVGGLELILPDERTAAHFDRLVEPLLAEIINLAKRIQNLRWTRDLLLPRLLSGKVELKTEAA